MARLFAVFLMLISLNTLAADHLQLVEETPCLFEYRAWFFTFRRAEPFVAPDGFTAEQCNAAKLVHERIQAEQATDRVATDRKAAESAEREARAQRDAAARAIAARAARARLPSPRIGMTDRQVLEGTSWGAPLEINSTITGRSITQQWVYPGRNFLYFRDGALTSIQTSTRP